MSGFTYLGAVPASKSLLNRALIARSFFPRLNIHGDSHADDVVKMRGAIEALKDGQTMDCGMAGTVLRFMALRAARIKGTHILTGEPRLFERPQKELERVLAQLGCQVEFYDRHINIRSWEWKMVGDALHIPADRSSQFASAVLLSAWDLPFDLCVLLSPETVSESYLRMTVQFLRGLGMQIDQIAREIRVPRGQVSKQTDVTVEPDMSSAFALAACAAVGGRATLMGFPARSSQPDIVFVEYMRSMGVPIESVHGHLDIHRAPRLMPIHCELGNAPDLFPVLAALAALADGESQLRGAPQLKFKESDRIKRTAELLRLAGRDVTEFEDGIKIDGRSAPVLKKAVWFDPDHDHRMAMAAAVLSCGGEPIHISEPQVVTKSFPEFWSAIGRPL